MKRTRVKICGLTRQQDVNAAVQCGADALGFVFAPRSPRRVQPSDARSLAASVPALVTSVGLFMDQPADEVARVLEEVPLGLLQFHGSEDAAYCKQFGLPYIKAVSMQNAASVAEAAGAHASAAGLVLDSHQPGGIGGTGEVFDWSLATGGAMPVLLAGGLNAGNVAAAIVAVRPWAVDVSSGVEDAPGIKNAEKISNFMQEVNRGDRIGS